MQIAIIAVCRLIYQFIWLEKCKNRDNYFNENCTMNLVSDGNKRVNKFDVKQLVFTWLVFFYKEIRTVKRSFVVDSC